MSSSHIAILPERGAVSVSGPDAGKLLQGLITNDIERVTEGRAIHAGLLSPQGKLLFEFFVASSGQGYVLDVLRDRADELVKRLTMYRLRADAQITNVSERFRTVVVWGAPATAGIDRAIGFSDPRHTGLGERALLETTGASNKISAHEAPQGAYQALRIACGAPEGGTDYAFGDAYPHEANLDLLNGVSFEKGCYVGQEIVARMQNNSVVRKRVVRVEAGAPLSPGADVVIGEVPIGRIGTVAGTSALAMLRLDRAIEALEKAIPLTAGGVALTPDQSALDRYSASVRAHDKDKAHRSESGQ
jgi:folate-binding protein YgfZ